MDEFAFIEGNFLFFSTISAHRVDVSGIDNIFVDIMFGSFQLTIGCVYRPRASQFDSIFSAHLASLSREKKNLLIVISRFYFSLDEVSCRRLQPS